MKSAGLLALMFIGPAAAQTVNSQDCLAYQLLSTQPDSILVKFNAKIIKLLVTPDTEIWRRGVDLKSPTELAVDDVIYVKCAEKPAAGGTPVATIIAGVQKDSGVDLTPHGIRETRVCMGRLNRIGPDRITVKNDKGECTAQVPAGTNVWRGETYHDTGVLKLGDQVGARGYIDYPSGELIADYVEANVAKTEGKIVSVSPDRIVVHEDRFGRVTVFIDGRTRCDDCSPGNLKKGEYILATGLEISKGSFRAAYITLER